MKHDDFLKNLTEVSSGQFAAKLATIRVLLAEAYEHYFANSDGHCKSSEGAISIHLPEYFWWPEHANRRPALSIYSYVLGPSRDHWFDNIDDALTTVKKWHKAEMEMEVEGE